LQEIRNNDNEEERKTHDEIELDSSQQNNDAVAKKRPLLMDDTSVIRMGAST